MAVMHFFNKKMKHGENKSEGKRLVLTMTTSISLCFCMLLPPVVNALRKGLYLPPSGEVFLHQEVLQTTEIIFCSAIKTKQLSLHIYMPKKKKEDL